jgi:hypothetical protein
MDPARIQGAASGSKTYRGGACRNPDHRGGDGKTERYVSNGNCVTCSREKARASMRRAQSVLRALSAED